jgi:endonuclease-8
VPEGDTVWLVCRRLHAALAGQQLVRAELRVPRWATAQLAGAAVREVVARGKHQLFRLDDGRTLHTHLRMEGAWRISPAARPPAGPRHQIRVLLATGQVQAVGYRLGLVNLVRTSAEHEVVGHLGPDLLSRDWDRAEAVTRLLADPRRTIGEALLDQRNLAGIGTLYRAETLFLAGVHPRTPVAEVPDVPKVVDLARRLLRANLESFDQITTGDRRLGKHWAFERTGLPCRRCGALIRGEKLGEPGRERPSYWCPACQPPS